MRVGELGAMATMLVAGIAGAEPLSEPKAEPKIEASGFVGIGWFGEDTQLGNSWAPEQVPGTAPVLGARLAYMPWPHALGGDVHLALGVEGELALATAFTGGASFSTGERGRMSYFAPVFGWRIHAVARLAGIDHAVPHLVVGVGGETVASSSPFMSKETDPEVYWGPGVAIPVAPAWQMRIDLRHGLMPARSGGVNSTVELQLGVATTFGPPVKRTARVAHVEPPEVAVDDKDSDGDGIPDRLDHCPNERETVNGIDDADGCPELDPDGDGILGDADKCPNQAEDFDGFEDADGCPEPDNDHDGIDDPRDACPNTPETRNGWLDDDGCPDEVPPAIVKALASAASVRFEPGRARLTRQADLALQSALAMLHDHPEVRVTIIGHPDRAGAEDLAKRRAEAVKWYFVDEGIVQDRLTTSVGARGTQAVELVLAISIPAHQ